MGGRGEGGCGGKRGGVLSSRSLIENFYKSDNLQ